MMKIIFLFSVSIMDEGPTGEYQPQETENSDHIAVEKQRPNPPSGEL